MHFLKRYYKISDLKDNGNKGDADALVLFLTKNNNRQVLNIQGNDFRLSFCESI